MQENALRASFAFPNRELQAQSPTDHTRREITSPLRSGRRVPGWDPVLITLGRDPSENENTGQ